jgi:hypothetical protein
MLVIVDEHTHECLAIDVARKLTSEDLLAICSSAAEYRTTFAVTTVPSSRPTVFEIGFRPLR